MGRRKLSKHEINQRIGFRKHGQAGAFIEDGGDRANGVARMSSIDQLPGKLMPLSTTPEGMRRAIAKWKDPARDPRKAQVNRLIDSGLDVPAVARAMRVSQELVESLISAND